MRKISKKALDVNAAISLRFWLAGRGVTSGYNPAIFSEGYAKGL
jgi:hypothetical protein